MFFIKRRVDTLEKHYSHLSILKLLVEDSSKSKFRHPTLEKSIPGPAFPLFAESDTLRFSGENFH